MINMTNINILNEIQSTFITLFGASLKTLLANNSPTFNHNYAYWGHENKV